ICEVSDHRERIPQRIAILRAVSQRPGLPETRIAARARSSPRANITPPSRPDPIPPEKGAGQPMNHPSPVPGPQSPVPTTPSPVPGPRSPVPKSRTLIHRKADDREPDKRPLDLGLITRLLTYMRPYAAKRNALLVTVVLRAIQLPMIAWSIG